MPVLVVLRLEKGIIQGDCSDIFRIDIVHKLRIDVEEHWHIHCFPSIQTLLLKAKTLDLAEVWCYLAGSHRVCRYSYYIVGRLVRCGVECEGGLAGQHANLALLRYEFPGKNV